MRARSSQVVFSFIAAVAASCSLPDTPPYSEPDDAGASGGAATGGAMPTGGTATGGASGSATGGTSTGGTSTGGTSTGGTSTGGTSTGGTSTGGTGGGGATTGGTGGTSAGAGGRGGTSAGAGAGGRGGTSAGGAGAGGAGAGGRGGTSAGGAGAGGTATAGVGGSTAGGGGTAGKGGPVVELAEGRSATADSEENNPSSNPPKVNVAPNANDGSATTRWCAANGGTHYWQVDLGASHSLSRVEIDFEYPTQAAGSSYGYLIGVSPDGTTFTTAIDRSANTSTTATQTATFPASTAGRYVRVTVNPPATTPATWSSFWEVRVYGQ